MVPDANPPGSSSLIDPQGEPLFDPDSLHHPRSAEWVPIPHVAQYLENRVRKPLSKETRNKLKAECPRPLIPNKMIQFLSKSGFNPRKGLDSALRACQDKLLDSLGPMTKFFELAETARIEGTAIDPEELSGWAQRAICLIGNVNSSLSIERRKALLMKIEPKLTNMALTETGKEAQGLLFGDSFIKDLGKFVGAFTALDKAQSSMRRVFHGRVSNRAGSFRGRLSGRVHFQTRGNARGPYNQRPSFQEQRQQSSFFPSRGQQFRSRGFRGNLGSRRPLGKSSKPVCFFQPLHRGQAPTFFTRLEPGYLRSVGTNHSPRVSNRSCGFSPVTPRPSSANTLEIVPVLPGPGAPFPCGQRSNRESTSSLFGGDQQYVFGRKEGRSIPSSNKLTESEQICMLPPFQNGRDSFAQGPSTTRGLDGEIGPERCLSDGSGVSSVQNAPPVLLARPPMAVHVPPVWPIVSPLVFHQVDETSGGLPSQSRYPSCDLPRRYPLHGSIPIGALNPPTSCDVSYYRSWIRHQHREVLPTSFEIDGIPGFCGELHRTDPMPPWIQNQIYMQGTSSRPETSSDVPASPGTHYRPSILVDSGDFSSSPLLPSIATTEDRPFASGCILCGHGDVGSRDEGRTHVVDLDAWNGKAIVGPQPDLIVESDASLLGWGAYCNGVSTGGPWSGNESHLHINALELLAGSFAIHSFTSDRISACIRLRMDNVSAVRYVNAMGGTHSSILTHLAKEFWSFCLDRGFTVVAEYIPGLHNTFADWSSRHSSDFSDWKLDPAVFSSITSIWGPLSMDLFASRWNAQLPHFYSWRPDPLSVAVDTLLQDWSGQLAYAFPPFALIPRVLSQVRRQLADLVLIVPFWQAQSWFPQLLELLVEDPRLLPSFPDLLLGPLDQLHPLVDSRYIPTYLVRLPGLS
ncbi:uncharacterized protein LOC120999096 [Bufo bufo]|uniref:uncharacterized protein LOC120999096 n=1 Tax=Bufo bufo TaxID=8384 RepID=UPI001ABDA1A6|nr:uncharacterized protein LOC120999096 [Bufo bufo]